MAVDQDGGVTLDDVADATKKISELLDSSDVMGNTPTPLRCLHRGSVVRSPCPGIGGAIRASWSRWC
ncbi:MAG: hypothetical protein R2709_08750 [Marmoricola sp.]